MTHKGVDVLNPNTIKILILKTILMRYRSIPLLLRSNAHSISCTFQSMSRNKKNNVYPCKPQFYYIKVGFKGVKII